MFVNRRTISDQRLAISRLQDKCTANVFGARRHKIVNVRVGTSILIFIREADRILRRETAR